MREIFIGVTIRQTRIALGLTQEQLCEGLCDPSTLSRIETGKQPPSRRLAKALFERLGLPHDRYYTFLTPREAEVEALRTTIDRCVARFQQSFGEEKRQARLEALEQLDQLEAITEAGNKIGRQYLLGVRAVLGDEEGPYPFEIKMDMLLKAIRLTVSRFDLETVGDWLYSIDETEIISQIAGTYSEAGQHKEAAGIFNQLLTYARDHGQDVTHPSRRVSPAALSYARELCSLNHHEEALKIAELGQKTCLDYGFCQSLPGLLTVMAECRYAMGEDEQSRELYRQAYYLYRETGNASGLVTVEDAARQKLGLEFLPREVVFA